MYDWIRMFWADHINDEITIGKHICTQLYLNINLIKNQFITLWKSFKKLSCVTSKNDEISIFEIFGVFYAKNNREIFIFDGNVRSCGQKKLRRVTFLIMWPLRDSDCYHLDWIEVERLHKSTFHPLFAPSVSPPLFILISSLLGAANKKRSVHWISNFARSFSSLLFDLLWNSKWRERLLTWTMLYRIK